MGLLTPTQITALESSQSILITEAGKAQLVLNALFADPENTKHSAWRPLWKLHQALKEAIVEAETVVLCNDDSYGEWKY